MRKPSERCLVWVAAAVTFAALAYVTGFFSFGRSIPVTTDINPGTYSQLAYHFPPQASISVNYWLGQTLMPQDLQPMSLLAHLPLWMFFTGYYPLFSALSLLACYAFLRQLQFRRGAALLGGIVYAWQGDLFSNILAGHFSSATVWFLFALAAYFSVRSAKEKSWYLSACCGVATGMMVSLLPDRGGLCSLLIGAFYLLEIWRKRATSEMFCHAGRLVLTVAVALCVAAPGVFSTLSWTTMQASQAGVETPKQKFEWATQWSYTPEEVLNYAVPGFLGWRNGQSDGPYWGRIGRSAGWQPGNTQEMRNFCLAIFTLGTAGFILALVGGVMVFVPRERQDEGQEILDETQRSYAKLAVAAVIVGWLLALGKYTPLYWYFYQLPYMDTWRNPLKFLAPVSLALVVLLTGCANVWARFVERGVDARARDRVQRIFNVIAFVLWIVWLLSFPLLLPLGYWLRRGDYDWAEVGTIFSTLRWSLFIAAGLVTFLAFLWKRLSRSPEERKMEFINPWIQRTWNILMERGNEGRVWFVFLAMVTVLQMFWVHRHYVELFHFEAFYKPNPIIEKLQPKVEKFRVTIEMGDPFLRQLLTAIFPYHGIQSVDIPAVSRMPDDYGKYFKATESNRMRFLQLAGVKYFLMPTASLETYEADEQFKSRVEKIDYLPLLPTTDRNTPTHALVEFKKYLPRAVVISNVEVIEREDDLLKRLVDPAWNPFVTILIDPSATRLAKQGDQTVPASAKGLPAATRIVQYDGRRIEVEVQSPRPAYLLINDRFNPNWKATVNGKPTEIFHANFIAQAVPIPAGESKVVMTYSQELPTFTVQLVVLALVAGWTVIWLVSRRKEARSLIGLSK